MTVFWQRVRTLPTTVLIVVAAASASRAASVPPERPALPAVAPAECVSARTSERRSRFHVGALDLHAHAAAFGGQPLSLGVGLSLDPSPHQAQAGAAIPSSNLRACNPLRRAHLPFERGS